MVEDSKHADMPQALKAKDATELSGLTPCLMISTRTFNYTTMVKPG
jgi:hypothetical protein